MIESKSKQIVIIIIGFIYLFLNLKYYLIIIFHINFIVIIVQIISKHWILECPIIHLFFKFIVNKRRQV